MYGTVLRGFQQQAVENASQILKNCLVGLSALPKENFRKNRAAYISDTGAVLLEAPTGAGKTLMAGTVVQTLSKLNAMESLPKVLWFWFAPFAGIVEQTVAAMQEEFSSLRIKDPATDRDISALASGDVFVTTWQSVAVANATSRKVRMGTETMPSLDNLVASARELGFAIGVVVDEAHHGFKSNTQALNFYTSVLDPDLTILATATPRDRDVDSFAIATGIANLRRISVSRQDVVDSGLIKESVKSVVFKAPTDVEAIVDFKKTALKAGAETHTRIKEVLATNGLGVVPLLLVQVDDSANAVDEATAWLKELGFHTEGESALIRSHTAKEPDPYLTSIAADESVEALIFKLAVATGFDAPRAFTLVSFRRSRDEDFGVQIVGRIMRVDRRLQSLANLPNGLNSGYVYLSDNESQTGLTSAADRINAVKSSLASVTSNIAVVAVGDLPPTTTTTTHGQTHYLDEQGKLVGSQSEPAPGGSDETVQPTDASSTTSFGRPGTQEEFGHILDHFGLPTGSSTAPIPSPAAQKTWSYPKRQDLGVPARLKKAVCSMDSSTILQDVVDNFRFDNDALLMAMKSSTTIIKREYDLFTHTAGTSENFHAVLAQKEIDARAQAILISADELQVIDMKGLHKALLHQFTKEVQRAGLSGFETEEKRVAGLNKILALRPTALRSAVARSITRNMISIDAEPLPEVLGSEESLLGARLNIYGVFPANMNTWELQLAQELDDDLTGTVRWWHRNPVRRPESVSLPLPNKYQFYPDFVVGVKNRQRGNGILLVETKNAINDQQGDSVVKNLASHPDYGNVMMLFWEDNREWQIVEYDAAKEKNVLERIFRINLMPNY